ncbi:MAG: phosphoadenosine phosphosulfate reductase, partial [Deltaproteobacteria bacterium]
MNFGSNISADLAGDSFNTYDVWLERLVRSRANVNAVEALGNQHFAYCEQGSQSVLLVSFENIQRLRRESPEGVPRGLSLAQHWGWSSLALLSTDDTWFRDKSVYSYFDDLATSDYFENFDRVVFYGAGPSSAYAAAAFSVAAPGAIVIAISPQATLDTA